MTAQLLSEVKRTGVNGDTYRSVYTLTYFGPYVFVQALSGTYTRECRAELAAHFRTMPNLKECWYIRRKKGTERIIKEPITHI